MIIRTMTHARMCFTENDDSSDKWWQNCTLLRMGPQEWYCNENGSYMHIHYIDSIEIEDEYQKYIDKQIALF